MYEVTKGTFTCLNDHSDCGNVTLIPTPRYCPKISRHRRVDACMNVEACKLISICPFFYLIMPFQILYSPLNPIKQASGSPINATSIPHKLNEKENRKRKIETEKGPLEREGYRYVTTTSTTTAIQLQKNTNPTPRDVPALINPAVQMAHCPVSTTV
jgi:hypothetical protein